MNRATCGLPSSDCPLSANLTPQENITQDSPNLGRVWGDLPCPDSGVVADLDHEGLRFEAPIGSETIGPDIVQSFSTQSLTGESETVEELMKPGRTG